MGARQAWNRYWFRPSPCLDLAVCRICIVGFQVAHLLVRTRRSLLWNASLLAHPVDPMPALRLFFPFGDASLPSFNAVMAIYWLTVAAGIPALVGFGTNLSLAAFAAGNVFLYALLYSVMPVHHPEAAVVIALALMALSPSGRALSMDVRQCGPGALEALSPFAGWSLRLMQWLIALSYLSAAYAKVAAGGLDWMNGSTLQYYLIEASRWSRHLGVGLGGWYPAAVVLSWVVVVFEGTFALVPLIPKSRWVYVPVGILLHAGMCVMLRVPFFSFMVLYAVCIPWTAAVQSAARRLEKWRTPVPSPDPREVVVSMGGTPVR